MVTATRARMTPGGHAERRGLVPGMKMPGPGLRDQLPGAGARAAARPSRPSSASKSAAAAAVPADRGMRARGDQGQGVAQRRPRRPRRARIAALGGLDDGDQAAELGRRLLQQLPGPVRRRRSQPRTVAAGTPSCTPSRAVPVPCSTDAAAARAITLTAPARRGAAQDGSRTCVAPQDRHRPRRGRSRPGRRRAPGSTRSRPQPHDAEPPGPGTRGRRARRTPGPWTRRPRRRTAASGQPSRSRHYVPRRAARAARGGSCCRLSGRTPPRNRIAGHRHETTR